MSLFSKGPDGWPQVLVATWPDGTELWRTSLTSKGVVSYEFRVPFQLDGVEAERGEFSIQVGVASGGFCWPSGTAAGDFRRAVVLYPTRVAPKSKKSKYSKAPDLTPKIRWAFWRLGFLPEGESPHPLNAKNPWIGRFRQDDLAGVLSDAVRLDHSLPATIMIYKILDLVDEGSGYVHMVHEREIGPYGASRGDLNLKAIIVVPRRDYGGMGNEHLKPSWWILDSGLEGLVRWMADREHHPDWVFLPRSEGLRVWRESLDPGQLSISDEEASVFDLLGETLPYTWPVEQLLPWVNARM